MNGTPLEFGRADGCVGQRNWDGFTRRLYPHLARMDAAGINYRIPDVLGLEADRLTLEDSVRVELATPARRGTMVFTLDGPDPGPGSARYECPFTIPVDEGGTELAARVILEDGRAGAVRRARFTRTRLAPPVPLPWDRRIQGLAVEGFRGWFTSVDAISGGEPLELGGAHFTLPRVALPEDAPAEGFGLRLTGYVRVPRKGIYTFILSSDDGSRLTIGDRVVVDHDGPHGMSERRGQVALHRGWHPLEVLFFQSAGGKDLLLEVEGPGVTRREVPATWLGRVAVEQGGPPHR